jgi:hypothetical protein
MCDHAVESIDHILLGCCFIREVWRIWLSKLHLQDTITVVEEPVMQWWLWVRKLITKALRRGFASLFFLIDWMLWKERNARTFDAIASPTPLVASRIHGEADSWCLAGFRHLAFLLASL